MTKRAFGHERMGLRNRSSVKDSNGGGRTPIGTTRGSLNKGISENDDDDDNNNEEDDDDEDDISDSIAVPKSKSFETAPKRRDTPTPKPFVKAGTSGDLVRKTLKQMHGNTLRNLTESKSPVASPVGESRKYLGTESTPEQIVRTNSGTIMRSDSGESKIDDHLFNPAFYGEKNAVVIVKFDCMCRISFQRDYSVCSTEESYSSVRR